MYLGYASCKGYSLLDGQLFVSQSWFADEHAALRTEVGLPSELAFKTKPALALERVQALMQRGVVPARWLAADGGQQRADCV